MNRRNEYKLKEKSESYRDANGYIFRYYSSDGNMYEMTDDEIFCGDPEELL